MYAGAYTLDLYCENYKQCKDPGTVGYKPTQYIEHHRATAFRKARKDGWRINTRKGTCYCPKCNREMKHGMHI